MERLTAWGKEHAYYPKCFEEPCAGMGCNDEHCEFKYEVCKRLAEYEDTGLTPEQISELNNFEKTQCAKLLLELREYQQAEAEGLLLRLPCREGTTVYIADYYYDCDWCKEEHEKYYIKESQFNALMVDEFEKTVFLTREEAEKKLAEMEGKHAGSC